jgi:methylmalonyl-CoA mutase
LLDPLGSGFAFARGGPYHQGMIDADETLTLAEDFPAPTRDEWLHAVEQVLLKGRGDGPDAFAKAFERRLVTTTYDGISVPPLFTAGDMVDPNRIGLPGAAPFVRGTRAAGRRDGWDIRQRIDVTDDGTGAAPLVLAELEGGASSIILGLGHAPTVDIEVLDRALTSVLVDLAPVVLDAGPRATEASDAFLALCARRGVGADALGGLGLDPIGTYASSGGSTTLGSALGAAIELAGRCAADFPGVRAITIDATRYHDAGGADADELGCALATGVATARALVAAGLDSDAAVRQLEFRFAATADQFLTIAKLRAARRLWARVAEVAGVGPAGAAQVQHAVTSIAMMSRYDPWVNLLRATVAAFSAGIAGADAVTVEPYDHVRTVDGSELGRRLARNTQAVLIEESNLARVIDPAGGSWYVEKLTDDLARSAWARFQEIEQAGGMVAALEQGTVQRRIADTWDERSRNLAHRRDALTGVSEFPNIDEDPPAPEPDEHATTGHSFAALPRVRYAGAFERQRSRADRAAAETGARPSTFLAALGPASVHTARVTFAKNLFEAGGIATVAGSGLIDDVIAEYSASGASLVCICSDDATYAEHAEATARMLRDAGAKRVYVATKPGENRAAFEAAGVDGFVFTGCDALAAITAALDTLEASA